jgi:hypothetical protein
VPIVGRGRVGEGSLLGILFALLFGIFFSGLDFGGLLLYSVAMRSRRGNALLASMPGRS